MKPASAFQGDARIHSVIVYALHLVRSGSSADDLRGLDPALLDYWQLRSRRRARHMPSLRRPNARDCAPRRHANFWQRTGRRLECRSGRHVMRDPLRPPKDQAPAGRWGLTSVIRWSIR
jgi:hypothetical protein